MGVELRISGRRPDRRGRPNLVRVHADSLCGCGCASRVLRKYAAREFLSFPGSASQSQGDRVATDAPAHVSCAGSVWKPAPRRLSAQTTINSSPLTRTAEAISLETRLSVMMR